MLTLGIFDITVNEDIGDCNTDGDGNNNRDSFDAAAQPIQQCGTVDFFDIEECEEQAVKQYTRNHRNC